jgi:hypothetical protein
MRVKRNGNIIIIFLESNYGMYTMAHAAALEMNLPPTWDHVLTSDLNAGTWGL